MKKKVIGVAAAGCALVCVLSVAITACFDYPDDCSYTLACVPPADGGSEASTSSSSSSGSPVDCDPTKSATAVDDACGVFVSVTGDDAATGTKEKPLKTLTAAVATGKTVYACVGASPFSEALAVASPVTLYGGLSCTTWVYSAATKTQLTASAGAVPLSLSSTANGSSVSDFSIAAVDATAPGGSSIAIVDSGAALALVRVDVTAGAGMAGSPGAAQAQVVTPSTANGANGADDPTCNMPGPIAGGGNGKNTCDTANANGGSGGNGLASTPGGDGQSGQPATPTNAGTGQTATTACTQGGTGAAGTPGTAGTGARGPGDIVATGYQSPTGVAGGAGGPGQGGGGGGGGAACDSQMMFAGPSGGGGGAGGCGGLAGNAGQSGGSSIGIASLAATITLTSVTITTAVGGAGGLGGDGQRGGNGGLAGNAGGGAACNGAKGGEGGAGGPGGGGAGGHSIGIAIQGGTLPALGTTTITHADAGAGARGGDMDTTAQTLGDTGFACSTFDFGSPSNSCAP